MAFFSFSSNISLLKWHELRKDMTSAYVDHILSRRSRWVYFSPAIFLSSWRGQRRPAHAFLLEGSFLILLALPLVLLWVWLTLLFQEKNEETRRVYFFIFYSSSYPVLLRGMIPIHLLRSVLDTMNCPSYSGERTPFNPFIIMLRSN